MNLGYVLVAQAEYHLAISYYHGHMLVLLLEDKTTLR